MLLRKMCMMSWLKQLMSLILGDLLLKNNYDNKITEIQGKIPSIAG